MPDRLLIAFLCLGIIFGLMATSKKKNALAFSGHSMGILFTGIISLGVYTGGYMAEVIRAGIEAIPKGQGYNYQKKYCPEVKTIFDNKDIMIDSSRFGIQKTACILCKIVREKFDISQIP